MCSKPSSKDSLLMPVLNINKQLSTNTNNNILTPKQQSSQQQQQQQRRSSTHDSGEESEGENEVIEESPEGRWTKRNEQVSQRDVPAIDQAYLAMDLENGYEVVWNEIHMSEKRFKSPELDQKLNQIFTTLININHPNIVKFHGYWSDEKNNKPRIVFITEYMSSGSLKQFLRKAKKTNQPIKKPTWKRWLVQLLNALHYLHNCEPPIIHRELSCDTIFIQHNGLIKIGSIAPDIVHSHVKTRLDNNWSKNVHFIAPELSDNNEDDVLLNPYDYGTPVDIYSFGMIALEMFNIELGGNGDHVVTQEIIDQSIESLEDDRQKDFIRQCLNPDPKLRPTAYQLLLHPLLIELHTLKLLSTHEFLSNYNDSDEIHIERIVYNYITTIKPQFINESITSEQRADECFSSVSTVQEYKYSILKCIEDLNKYIVDVKSGLYPITAYIPSYHKTLNLYTTNNSIMQTSNMHGSHTVSGTQSPIVVEQRDELLIVSEKRKAQNLSLQITPDEQYDDIYTLVITIKFEDKTKRHIEAVLETTDTAVSLADELISYGLISEEDKEGLINVLNQSLKIREDKSKIENAIGNGGSGGGGGNYVLEQA